jgi:O-antigen/teichoic acid export membrane protein
MLPTLMVLVFGADFADAAPLALALLPSRVVAGCSMIAGGYLHGRNQAHQELRARLAGAAVMTGCVFLFWPALAEFSIPWAALAGHGVACAITCLAVFVDFRAQRAAAYITAK